VWRGEGERKNGGDEKTLFFSAVDGVRRWVHSGESGENA